MIKCEICGREFELNRSLSSHVITHKITIQEYYDKYFKTPEEGICLDELQKYTEYKIIRNPQIIGYFPDGLIEELKLDIEFDEKEHDYQYHIDSDIIRDQDFEHSGYQVFRIKEKDWFENKETVINEFKRIITNG